MSLIWVANGITVDLQPSHGRWRFWVAEGRDELPTARTSSQLIPFRRGRLHQAGTADRRPLEVRGYLKDATDAAMRAQLDLLKGLLDPEADEMGTLVDDFEDGSRRWIRAASRDVISRYAGTAGRMLSIQLDALDPYWYGSNGYSALDSGLLLNDGNALDQGAWIVVTPTATVHALDIDIPGTADIERIRVEMTGPSSAPPGLEVVTPDGAVGFTLGAALAVGQVVELDNSQRTVLIAGVSQRAGMVLKAANRHGEYVRLMPGATTIRVLGQPSQVRILFTPTYQ